MSWPETRRPLVVGIARSPAFSPLDHAGNDAAILDATLAELAADGWRSRTIRESDVLSGPLPPADLYLNMCQGEPASQRLAEAEALGLRFYNRPSSALGCHRSRMIPALTSGSIAFPRTVVIPTTSPLSPGERAVLGSMNGGPLWLKRGDVHAERPEDVLQIRPERLEAELAVFAKRGIRLAAVQAHVEGTTIKFYGVGSGAGAFFHAYVSETRAPVTPEVADLAAIRALAFKAAQRLRLDIFGGDLVASGGRLTLIDLNDWPSFAPVRDAAAQAIARHVSRAPAARAAS